MRIFLAILIITFSLQSWIKAEEQTEYITKKKQSTYITKEKKKEYITKKKQNNYITKKSSPEYITKKKINLKDYKILLLIPFGLIMI